MDLEAVMDQVAERLRAIAGLTTVTPHPIESADPPAAAVQYPDEIAFDETYGRGMDRMTLPVIVVVGAVFAAETRTQLAKFCNGSGAASVKAVLESGEYDAFDTLRVASIQFDTALIGNIEYVRALFTLDIAGSGSS